MKSNRYPMFPTLCVSMGLPKPVAELTFHPTRKWRFDFAWPEYKVALEVNGGSWIAGRHNTGSGSAKDREKFTNAAMLGWRIAYCTPQELNTSALLLTIRQCLYPLTSPSS
jgi:very-short-patch-repair endonuclease